MSEDRKWRPPATSRLVFETEGAARHWVLIAELRDNSRRCQHQRMNCSVQQWRIPFRRRMVRSLKLGLVRIHEEILNSTLRCLVV